MSPALSVLRARWDEFFYAPCDPRLLALLRIGFASLVLLQALLMLPHFDMLWSVQGVLPLAELYGVAGGFVPTLFSVLPNSDVVLWLGYALLLLHASLLLVGYRSRLQLVCTLVWLISFQNRNPLVQNGQDAVLRMIGVFLAFAPIGGAWSVDARRASRAPRACAYFPVRLVQAQIAIVMLSAGIWKLRGDDWVSGTALYYVTRLEGFWGNLPLPHAATSSRFVLQSLGYVTLVLELCVPIAIWLPRARRAALATAIGFHACLAYGMNLFLFAPIMMLGWCAFLQRADFDGAARGFARARRYGVSIFERKAPMRHPTAIAIAILCCSAISATARAETPAPPPAPPTPSPSAAAGARGEETYVPGPGGGKLDDQGLPLESTGLEDGGPPGCKCSLALGSRSGSNGAAWIPLGLAALTLARRRKKSPLLGA